jgi:hypothetical protein
MSSVTPGYCGFHVQDSLVFEKMANGGVRVVLNGSEIVPTLDASAWASVIANMSYYGEEDYGFYRALNFHIGASIPESCPLVEKPPMGMMDVK